MCPRMRSCAARTSPRSIMSRGLVSLVRSVGIAETTQASDGRMEPVLCHTRRMRAELLEISYEDSPVQWPVAVVVIVGIVLGLWFLSRVNRDAAKALAIALVATVILPSVFGAVLGTVFD